MIEIRFFREDDIPSILDLQNKEYSSSSDHTKRKLTAEFRSALRESMWESKFDPNGFFLAFDGEIFVGAARAHINKCFNEAHGVKVGFISPAWPWSPLRLPIHPCYGDGKLECMLLRKCMSYLQERCMEYAQTCVTSDSTSKIGFLSKHGFTVFKRVANMRRNLHEPISRPKLPEGYSFREFEVGKEAELVDCHNEIFREEWLFIPRSATGFVNSFEKHPDFDPSGFFNLMFGDKLVGFSWNSTDRNEKAGSLRSLGVSKEHRGQGLGKALVSKSLIWHMKKGMDYVDLETHEDGRVGFYEKIGFQKTGEWIVLRKKI